MVTKARSIFDASNRITDFDLPNTMEENLWSLKYSVDCPLPIFIKVLTEPGSCSSSTARPPEYFSGS